MSSYYFCIIYFFFFVEDFFVVFMLKSRATFLFYFSTRYNFLADIVFLFLLFLLGVFSLVMLLECANVDLVAIVERRFFFMGFLLVVLLKSSYDCGLLEVEQSISFFRFGTLIEFIFDYYINLTLFRSSNQYNKKLMNWLLKICENFKPPLFCRKYPPLSHPLPQTFPFKIYDKRLNLDHISSLRINLL